MATLPLEGIRVVDLTVVWAGPWATMMLGDLGAEVIRVESPRFFPVSTRGLVIRPSPAGMKPGSYYSRLYPDSEVGEKPWNRFAMFNRSARNKLSCCVDLTRPEGREVVARLIRASDVLIENNAARTMERLGLSYDEVSQWNPRIIYINNPGFGMTGPYRDYVVFGVNVEAMTGHTWLRGYDDAEHPQPNSPIYHMDASGGACGALAVLMALYYRSRTGKGVYIDMAGAETAIPQFGEAIMDYTMNHRVHRTIGNRDIHGAAPQGCYRCRGGTDEWLTISVTSHEEWQGFCRAIGDLPWTQDPRFSDAISRWRNQDALDKLVEDWTRRHDKYEAMIILQKEGVPAGPVIGDKDAQRDPQLTARGFFEVIRHRECGTHRYPGFLWKYSKTPMSVRLPPCCMGEHNDYVFNELLAMPQEERTALEKDLTIGGDGYIEAKPPGR